MYEDTNKTDSTSVIALIFIIEYKNTTNLNNTIKTTSTVRFLNKSKTLAN